MNINIKGTSITLTPDIRDYVMKKLESVNKFFAHDSTAMCDIELAKSTGHQKGDIFKAEVHITAKGVDLYASAEESSLFQAIDVVKDEIIGETRSMKSKKLSLLKRSGGKIKDLLRKLKS